MSETIMKVSELPYRRYTAEEGKAAITRFEEKVKAAKCADDVLSAREEFLCEVKHYSTASSLANCRFTLNTRDEFYGAEMAYYDEVSPVFSDYLTRYAVLMLTSPFRKELETKINPRIFKSFEVQTKAFSPETIEDRKRENALVTEYSKFMSEMVFSYEGKDLPLSVLRGYLSDKDRNVRRAACEAIGKGLEKNAATLDRIYDDLVKVRTEMAKKMGYENFVELGYYRMGRLDYDEKTVKAFRDNVKADLVPAVFTLKRELQKSLGIDKMMFYDDAVYTKDVDPRPILDVKGIFKEAQTMYDEMHKTAGDFMRKMQAAEAFDVEARDGKWGGGYCTAFADFAQPFILANFNGSSDDIDVITHEFGHALAANFVFHGGDLELDVGGMETAECHSMSMEFLADRYMERFFGDTANAYRYKHVLSALSFIPYGVIVDEFQHEVYAHPEYTPEDRKALYRSLEAKYRPWLSFDGIPYLEEGTRWQYQMHIFESPFYYIDYCLAQTVAFGFLLKTEEDYGKALEDYLCFASQGGQKAFPALVAEAGIPSPFEEGALKTLAEKVLAFTKELAEKL